MKHAGNGFENPCKKNLEAGGSIVHEVIPMILEDGIKKPTATLKRFKVNSFPVNLRTISDETGWVKMQSRQFGANHYSDCKKLKNENYIDYRIYW